MAARLLIANRGEIVRRIARTCRRIGMEFVTVYSEADADAAGVEGAVASVCIGPAASVESYLSIDRLLAAASETGCSAVHPGYGFLSESSLFARAVADAGLLFVGPDADTIESMGDKARAKARMAAAGLAVIPGSAGASDDAGVVASMIRATGLPALLKPAAGGGGKGMEIVRTDEQIEAAVDSSIRVARSAFGDGRILVERLVPNPRHIEVQIFGDSYGNVVHLFERECSLQRRHQKIVEEAPAPNLDDETRRQIRSAAIRGARAIGYRNAGTFEFIVGADRAFYFLEANTRLQVEHPVTEMVTSIDLVEWQLRVAQGEPLPLTQSEIAVRGHAIECRVYAEDPGKNFLPAPGRVVRVVWPEDLRVETAVTDGTDVTPHYDPMLAKLIAFGATRDEALAGMRDGLLRTKIFGVTTNIGFLLALLADAAVAAGRVDTGYVDADIDRFAAGLDRRDGAVACVAAMALARALERAADAHCDRRDSPWLSAGLAGAGDRARLDPVAPLGRVSMRHGDAVLTAGLMAFGAGRVRVRVGCDPLRPDEQFHVVTCRRDPSGFWSGTVNDAPWAALVWGEAIEVVVAGQRVRLDLDYPDTKVVDGELVATAPMTGKVVVVNVRPGEAVAEGTVLAVVEAMKMENAVRAPRDATVKDVLVASGDSVSGGQALVVLEA